MYKPSMPSFKVIDVKTGRILGTTRTVNAERAALAVKAMLNFHGEVIAEREPCSNSGDPGEACDCCDEIEKV